jgi:TolB protein
MRSIGRVVSTRTLLILATLCVPAPATAQAWAPKGDLIAYWFLEPEDIWVVSPTGDGLRVLVDDPERDFGPAWDPTGDRLLFTSVRDGYHAIYSVDLSTGVERKLSPPDSENSDASLSPDGRWMVYTSDRSGDPEIWLEPLDGSTAPRQLTHRRGMDAAATFSPDGRQILTLHGPPETETSG